MKLSGHTTFFAGSSLGSKNFDEPLFRGENLLKNTYKSEDDQDEVTTL
jgi:hypothetical protein